MTIRLFRQHIRGPFLLLALTEALVMFASVYVAAHLRFAGEVEAVEVITHSVGPLPYKALAFASVLLMTTASMGLYRAQQFGGGTNVVLRIMMGYGLGIFALIQLFYFLPHLYLGRGVFLTSAGISFVLVLIVRSMFFGVVNKNVLKRRVLVYGAGDKACVISNLTNRANFYIVGFIQAASESAKVPSHKLIKLEIPLAKFAVEEEVDEIVVAVQDRRQSLPLDDLLNCRLSGIEILDLTNFLERETGKLNIATLSHGWLIFSDGFVQGILRRSSQRLFDVVTSSALLVAVSPIMLVAALAIRLESGKGQPILYRQARVGRHQHTFEILKFRSMRVDAEAMGQPVWATEGDNRITRVGAVMRKYRIDELPQLFNILRGDMSLVGPRPERPEFVDDLCRKIPFYLERHRVKPGLAGWAQMHYPYGATEKDAYHKLQYDLYYVKNGSLFLDFMILLQTAEIILWGKGAR
jgi:sugar transferase (PEP-CTERM system associated)